MRQVPTKCPSCGEQNIHNLDYCSICGKKFTSGVSQQARPKAKKLTPKDKKINAKRLKKRHELTELYKKKKISTQQYAAGLRKLGYSTNVEKAEAFKNYIQDQIVAMQNMQIDPNAREGDVYHDPNQADIDLPRDANGNVIVDFTAPTGGEQGLQRKPTESMPIVDHGNLQNDGEGPRFGQSLFGNRSGREEKRVIDRVGKKETPRMLKEDGAKKKGPVRRRAHADWDDDEEEETEEDDEEFDIDLDEENGESGWWDDEEWELEWTDEDEADFDEYEIEYDDEEEEGWVLEFDEEEEEEEDHHEISFDEDDDDNEIDEEDEDSDDDDEFELDGDEEYEEEEEDPDDEDDFEIDDDEEDEEEPDDEDDFEIEEEDDIDEEDDDEDWSLPRGRRRNQKR